MSKHNENVSVKKCLTSHLIHSRSLWRQAISGSQLHR